MGQVGAYAVTIDDFRPIFEAARRQAGAKPDKDETTPNGNVTNRTPLNNIIATTTPPASTPMPTQKETNPAGKCIPKQNCPEGGCYLCTETDVQNEDECKKLPAFCEWVVGSSCTARSTCTHLNDSVCEGDHPFCTKPNTITKKLPNEDVCNGLKEQGCRWTEDCRQCDAYTTNRECAVREFCEWKQGTLDPYEITQADLVFVGLAIFFDALVIADLLYWQRRQDQNQIHNKDQIQIKWFLIISFVADVAFTVGKLFPAQYICKTQDCNKLTHNAVMTFCVFTFDFLDSMILYAKNTANARQGHDKLGVTFKVLNVFSGLVYIIYDMATSDTPGIGSAILIALACLSELILLAIEAFTFVKSYREHAAKFACLNAMMSLGNRIMTITSGQPGSLQYKDILSDEFLKEMFCLQFSAEMESGTCGTCRPLGRVLGCVIYMLIASLSMLIAVGYGCPIHPSKPNFPLCAGIFAIVLVFAMPFCVVLHHLWICYQRSKIAWKLRRVDFGENTVCRCAVDGQIGHEFGIFRPKNRPEESLYTLYKREYARIPRIYKREHQFLINLQFHMKRECAVNLDKCDKCDNGCWKEWRNLFYITCVRNHYETKPYDEEAEEEEEEEEDCTTLVKRQKTV